MAGDSRITQSSDALHAAARETSAAGDALSGSTAALRTAVPSGAFGMLGEGIVAAANSAGTAIGGLLGTLSRLAEASAQGVSATQTEFERIEDAATARFGRMGSDR